MTSVFGALLFLGTLRLADAVPWSVAGVVIWLSLIMVAALIPGLILGVMAIVRIGGDGGRSDRLAIVGVCISGLMLLLVTTALLFPVFGRARESAA